MRDLYLHLNLEPQTRDEAAIRQAISECADPTMSHAGEHVLLNPQRKLFYDQQHQLLTTIGKLRERLSIPRSNAWEELDNHDFDHYDPGEFDDLGLFNRGAAADEMGTFDNAEGLGDDGFGDMGDAWDDLGLDEDESGVTFASRFRLSRYTGPISPRALFLFVGVAAFFCVAALVVSAFQNVTPLPSSGQIIYAKDRNASGAAVTIENGPNGHAIVDFKTRHDLERVLCVFVRAGENAPASLPPGQYVLEFTIGEESDWNGETFRRTLREVDSRSIPIPYGKNVRVP